ncbi:MAG: pH regulation protein F [Burkholderiales bacterium]|nr:pH regulation protein F [Burkholderiales bacterium]
MFEVASISLLIALTGIIARALIGPTVFDRTQAVNTAGTVAMLLLAVVGFLNKRPDFLDIAIIYGLLNVIGTIAVLKYFRHGDLGDPGDESKETRDTQREPS